MFTEPEPADNIEKFTTDYLHTKKQSKPNNIPPKTVKFTAWFLKLINNPLQFDPWSLPLKHLTLIKNSMGNHWKSNFKSTSLSNLNKILKTQMLKKLLAKKNKCSFIENEI